MAVVAATPAAASTITRPDGNGTAVGQRNEKVRPYEQQVRERREALQNTKTGLADSRP